MPNHEQAQHRFTLSCKMLVDTYLREYNEYETGLLSINFVIFLYAIKKIFLIILA
jgi:hypothetical protein